MSNLSLQHFSNGNTVVKASIVWLVLYGASVALSKLATLLLYLRVFTAQWRGFTLVLILISIEVIGTGVTNAFAAIFQCSPVSHTWDKTVEGGKYLEPANYIIAACLPTLRPIFVRVLPDKFSILTRKRDSSQRAEIIGLVAPRRGRISRWTLRGTELRA